MAARCSNVLVGVQGTEMTEDQNYIGGTAREQISWMEYSNSTIFNSLHPAMSPVNDKRPWKAEKAQMDEWLFSE